MTRLTNTALRRSAQALLGAACLAPLTTALAAQDYAVVQAVPPPASGELSEALRRLARNPGDFEALVAAGRASLAMGDVDAAIGFFGRADVLRPGDPRIKAGLASANLKQDRPIEALALFDQAQAAGALPASIAADRGLAFDLVGDNVSAQLQYRLALAQGPDAEVTRRLGLSQAIAGDKKGFEATLLPLLQKRDFAAYRVRSFGLAILGEEQEARSIAEAVMPRDLASRITPYLSYMPRLTRAQQAAAANLGAFPRAAQIGRDDPRFAAYAGPQTAPRPGAADARLAPAGQPLGPKAATPARPPSRSQRAADKRAADAAEAKRKADLAEQQRLAAAKAEEQRQAAARAEQQRLANEAAERQRLAALAEQQRRAAALAEQQRLAAAQAEERRLASLAQQQQQQQQQQAAQAAVVRPSLTLPEPAATAQPVVVAQAAPPPETASILQPVVVAQLAAPAQPAEQQPPTPESLADAFAEFAQADAARIAASGAVDITKIKPKREVAEAPKPAAPPPPPKPTKPKHPSREWVQVATGKDTKALAFDWRKYAKKAPQLLGKREAYTAKWGVTRRLVTGPFDSAKAADKFVADLKKAGIDSFTFTSSEGEEVAALD